MYISRIRLRNIRSIEELDIDLYARSATNNSLLLLGDNAIGKSTILRSIALGLCDRGSASGLLGDLYGNLVTDGRDTGSIELDLRRGNQTHTIATTIVPAGADSSAETLKKDPEHFPWGDIFLCGYGPTRVIQGTNDYSEYVTADAVYGLFNYGWALQNPELVLRRRSWKDPDTEEHLLQTLATILMLDRHDSLSLSSHGLTLRMSGSGSTTFGALADGHRSTLNWVLDLIGWTHLTGQTEPRGIVLIDEIENHLHPTWQRNVLRLLAQQFPRVQFITTSHSPFPTAGIYEDKLSGYRIGTAHVLRKDATGRVVNEELPVLYGQSYDQILESSAFSTPARPAPLDAALAKVVELYSGPSSRKTPEFRAAMDRLRKISPMTAAVVHEKHVATELAAEFDALVEQPGDSDAPPD